MKWLKIILINFAVFVLLLELVLEALSAYKNYARANSYKPVYSWSLYSRSGVQLSNETGVLRLQLAPFVSYRNQPNKKPRIFQSTIKDFAAQV